jgi:hypothetical protein
MNRPHWIPLDSLSHLYTLILRLNGTFEMLIDDRSIRNGTFLADFTPPLFEPPTMDDPNDRKPDDWVDDILVPDPNAVKPADWDDDAPEFLPGRSKTPPPGWRTDIPPRIPQPYARKPDTWDEDAFGPWQAPEIPNPACLGIPGCGPYTPAKRHNPKAKGVWQAPYVRNPRYIGEWRARQIPNPAYHGQSTDFPIPNLTAIGFNFWAANRDIAVTNIIIANDEDAIRAWNREDFVIRQRRQVRLTRIRYDWINVDLPDDAPEPGIFGRVGYYWRSIAKKWRATKRKALIIAGSATGVCLVIVLALMLVDYFDDPFEKLKQD